MAALVSDWLRHFRLLLWNSWMEFNETWHKSKFSLSSTKFVFFGSMRKTRWPAWPLPDWVIFYFSYETAEGNLTQLDRKQDLKILYQVFVFRADLKKQDGRPGLWLAETFPTSPLKPLKRIQRNLTGSKISTSSTKFVFFESIGKNNMAALASDLLKNFRLLLWNRWREFNETRQEGKSQCPLPSLYFWADPKNKMAALAPDWLRHFRCLLLNRWTEFSETFSLKSLNRIQRKLSGCKNSTSLTKFVFFRPICKQKWSPWPIRQKDGTLYSLWGPLGLLLLEYI